MKIDIQQFLPGCLPGCFPGLTWFESSQGSTGDQSRTQDSWFESSQGSTGDQPRTQDCWSE